MSKRVDIVVIESALHGVGLVSRGGFHPRPEDAVPLMPGGTETGTIILAGNVGHAMWRRFQQATSGSTQDHPLNSWTRELLDAIARHFGAHAMFPFDGPLLLSH